MRFWVFPIIFLVSWTGFLHSGWTQSLEARAKHIESLLVAPCCWHYPVSEHHSEAAMEIKQGIREMLTAGKTETDILAFYEEKFGEKILARPTTRGFNVLIWILPGVMLLFGAAVASALVRRWRSRSTQEEDTTPPTVADEAYVKKIDQELYGA